MAGKLRKKRQAAPKRKKVRLTIVVDQGWADTLRESLENGFPVPPKGISAIVECAIAYYFWHHGNCDPEWRVIQLYQDALQTVVPGKWEEYTLKRDLASVTTEDLQKEMKRRAA